MRAMGQPWELAVFLWVPSILFAVVVASELHLSGSLKDWEIFRTAAHSIAHGRSPFPPATPAALAHGDKYVYPPVTALLLAPLAFFPVVAGTALFLLVALGCVLLALRLLGVSDWRCYGLAVLTAPVVDTLSLGAISSMLLLGVALVWRYRDRPAVAGAVTAATAVAKLFVWPLFVWLLATRRFRAASIAAGTSLLLLLGGWAVIGFAGLGGYPNLLRVLTKVDAVQSYSLAGLLRVDGGAATALSALLAIAVIAGIFLAARGPESDRRALTIAVAGALLATPVLWLHYLDLLFVPLALVRPRLSALWFAPLAFWITPLAHSGGSVWRICLVLVVAAYVVWRTFAPTATAAAARRSGRAESPRVLASS
ncbi:MAG: glycosyltransferase family 87 protein [Gaiellaceae bacterium]